MPGSKTIPSRDDPNSSGDDPEPRRSQFELRRSRAETIPTRAHKRRSNRIPIRIQKSDYSTSQLEPDKTSLKDVTYLRRDNSEGSNGPEMRCF